MINRTGPIYSSAKLLCISAMFVSFACRAFAQEKPASSNPPGISTERPEEGFFVELPDGRFMVPYTQTIPGSKVKFEMVPIPGGTFLMGSPEDEEGRRADEGPQIELKVAPFWMGKYEVTWGEYIPFMDLDGVFKEFAFRGERPVTEENRIDAVAVPSSLYDSTFTFMAGEEPDQPCATPTQLAAKQYTKYVSLMTGNFYRLPTEAEWEYACRAGTTTRFYFGDDESELENHGWYEEISDDERHAVGELEPNPWGLYDMYGNVAEWVLDGYSKEGYAALQEAAKGDGSVYLKSDSAYPRVIRGGSFELQIEDCRSAARMASDDKSWKNEDPNFPKSATWFSDSPATGVGFRIMRPLDPPADRNARESFWEADSQDQKDAIASRMNEGKGAVGIVDPTLNQAIRNADK